MQVVSLPGPAESTSGLSKSGALIFQGFMGFPGDDDATIVASSKAKHMSTVVL
jgi:hypothetical protein